MTRVFTCRRSPAYAYTHKHDNMSATRLHVSSDGVQHAYGDGGHDGVTACTRHKNKDENINSKRRKNQFSSSVCMHSLGGDEDEAALRDLCGACTQREGVCERVRLQQYRHFAGWCSR